MTAGLLALRFVVELCLLAAFAVIGWGAVANHAIGIVVGLLLALVVALIWGMLLSPRRKVDLPVGVRVALELVLFGAAALGLVAAGHAPWGIALIVAEVLVLVALALRGLPPGSDVSEQLQPRT